MVLGLYFHSFRKESQLFLFFFCEKYCTRALPSSEAKAPENIYSITARHRSHEAARAAAGHASPCAQGCLGYEVCSSSGCLEPGRHKAVEIGIPNALPHFIIGAFCLG